MWPIANKFVIYVCAVKPVLGKYLTTYSTKTILPAVGVLALYSHISGILPFRKVSAKTGACLEQV